MPGQRGMPRFCASTCQQSGIIAKGIRCCLQRNTQGPIHIALRLPQKRLRKRTATGVEDGGGANGPEALLDLAKRALQILFVGDVNLVAHSRAAFGLNLRGQALGVVC